MHVEKQYASELKLKFNKDNKSEAKELYDMKKDPNELNDLASTKPNNEELKLWNRKTSNWKTNP